MLKPCSVGLSLVVLAGSVAPAAAAPPGGWDAWIPDSATAVLKVDVTALNSSPLAAREGWGRRHTAGTPADVTSLPDGVTALVAATDLSPRTLDDTWRVALLDLAAPLSAADLIARQGGRIDTVRGQTVVVTPRNLLLVPIDPTHVAARQPADRHALARWVAAGRAGGGGRPSDYLLRALAGTRAPVTAALDLSDANDVVTLRQRLQGTAAMAGRGPADLDAAARVLAGLKGVTLTVRVTTTIEAEIVLTFSEPAGVLAPVLLPLVREALESAGAGLDDLSRWSARVDGPTGLLSGRLTDQSFRLVTSPFFSPPSLSAASPASSLAPATAGEDPKAAASLTYFRGLSTLVEQMRSMKGLDVKGRVKWYNEYARKIEALPMLDVDPDLLKLGPAVSGTFRGLSIAAANANNRGYIIDQNRVAAVGTVPVGGYAYGYTPAGYPVGFGYSAPATVAVSNDAQINNLLAANTATESAMRSETWRNIEAAMTDMRQRMTTRYRVEFPAAMESVGRPK